MEVDPYLQDLKKQIQNSRQQKQASSQMIFVKQSNVDIKQNKPKLVDTKLLFPSIDKMIIMDNFQLTNSSTRRMRHD